VENRAKRSSTLVVAEFESLVKSKKQLTISLSEHKYLENFKMADTNDGKNGLLF
jgi:hypothetical protein